jgi:hypothetical protein
MRGGGVARVWQSPAPTAAPPTVQQTSRPTINCFPPPSPPSSAVGAALTQCAGEAEHGVVTHTRPRVVAAGRLGHHIHQVWAAGGVEGGGGSLAWHTVCRAHLPRPSLPYAAPCAPAGMMLLMTDTTPTAPSAMAGSVSASSPLRMGMPGTSAAMSLTCALNAGGGEGDGPVSVAFARLPRGMQRADTNAGGSKEPGNRCRSSWGRGSTPPPP